MSWLPHCSCSGREPGGQSQSSCSGSDATMTTGRELGGQSHCNEACHYERLQSGQTEWGTVVSERTETSVGFHINKPLKLPQMMLRTASKVTFLYLCMYECMYVGMYVYKSQERVPKGSRDWIKYRSKLRIAESWRKITFLQQEKMLLGQFCWFVNHQSNFVNE